MAQKVSNNSNWMAQFNYDVSQEIFKSYEINSVIDGNTDIDGNWGTDDTYMEYDVGDTLQETRDYGKINLKAAKIVGKVAIGASAALITAALVMELISGYKPTLSGLYSVDGASALCIVDDSSETPMLSYAFEVTYKVSGTLFIYIGVGEETTEITHKLVASQSLEGVTYTFGSYKVTIDNEDEPFAFPLGYEGTYSFAVSADYGFGLTSISSLSGRVS